jgi:hypothetical protein
MNLRGNTPRPGRPLLQHVADEDQEALDAMALARAGGVELTHDLNGVQRVDMRHSVVACGRCGGVRGGDGVIERDGKHLGRCPTPRCVCGARGTTRADQ